MKIALPLLVLFWGSVTLSTKLGANERGSFCGLTEFKHWKRLAAIPLDFPTYHPQGLLKVGDDFYLSTVDKGGKRGFLIQFVLGPSQTQRGLIGRQILRMELTDGARYHPGGIDWDSIRGILYSPVAEYRAQSSASVLAVDLARFRPEKIFEVQDHMGTTVFQPAGAQGAEDLLHFFNWDVGMVTADIHGKTRPLFVPPKTKEYGDYEYQDCKHVSETEAVCGATRGHVFQDGALDLIRFDRPTTDGGAPGFRVLKRIKVPNVWTNGRKIWPSFFGLPLTQNPMAYEIVPQGSAGEGHLRLYFMPYDGSRSRLLIYDLPSQDCP